MWIPTEHVIYATKRQWSGLKLNADELSVLNDMTFLSVDTILLVGSDFRRMVVNRVLANREHEDWYSKVQYTAQSLSKMTLCARHRGVTPTCHHSRRQKECGHVSVRRRVVTCRSECHIARQLNAWHFITSAYNCDIWGSHSGIAEDAGILALRSYGT